MSAKSGLRNWFENLFVPPKPLLPGSHAMHSAPDAPFPYRMHLRIEPDGSGLLILNAATVLHLNQTAAEFAYQFISGESVAGASRVIARRYKVNRQQAQQDYEQFLERIQTILQTPDLDPQTYLDMERQTPYSKALSAPYRLDCAVTYRLPADGNAADAPQGRAEMEMTTEQWKAAIDTAWKVGIPHLVFTGGEPTLREDLPDLLGFAEANGQVSGLLTDGLRLADVDYFHCLARKGLDHIMIVLRPELERSWDALRVVLPDDIFTAVHLTITPQNRNQVADLLARLAEMGVNGISLSAADPALAEDVHAARTRAADLHLNLVWDLPVPYSASNPVTMEVTDEPLGAGKAWLYMEPDGDILPAQGVTRVLGNLLRDPWEIIWKNAQS